MLTLSQIVKAVEIWVCHFEPQTKGQSIEWHHPQISQEERISK
jgi:ribosome recycling factor